MTAQAEDRARAPRHQTRLLIVCHSPAAVDRAALLFAGTNAAIVACPPGSAGIRRAFASVMRTPASLVYLVDVGKSTLAAAIAARAIGRPFVLDTGDLAFALATSTGSHSAAARMMIRLGEAFAVRFAAHIVVRGREHVRFLGVRAATVVPDVAPASARPLDGSAMRARLGLDDAYVVGLVGSLVLARRLGTSYGWDVVEALPHCYERVCALIVGDGDGREKLERRAEQLGVLTRCRFVGRVPSEQVAEYIAAMDVGVSTQSNDAVGSVRTTGKLPLYLACGLPVLATDVGEAHHLLSPLGWTLPYVGTIDRDYPRRLATAIERWRTDGDDLARRRAALGISRSAFDLSAMRHRVRGVVDAAAKPATGRSRRHTPLRTGAPRDPT